MKKRIYSILIIVFILTFMALAVYFGRVNPNSPLGEKIDHEVIQKLSATRRIVIGNTYGSSVNGITTDENIILEIIHIISRATMVGEYFTCPLNNITFRMYDENHRLIDTILVWTGNGGIIPGSLTSGCARYSLTAEDGTLLDTIIENITGTKFFTIFDYSEVCDDALEFIYEDNNYRYYFNCIKSDKMFIEFSTTNIRMTIKEALENNHITINEILEIHWDLFIKIENNTKEIYYE